ncbi:hypothetical protein H696_03696 [Fonticula alba]|uniref:Nucleolus and neural progenitor protein-like N-terminal domain-containing protein n=1 Tax=Fonticula alba TaxID=691883 RepID=A0A058Z4Q0_FONAL|nr:hypothetical protein H696_03696 [Fonticula alba]KCV69269.1 hypothetical protein H696_03696 [Fonticula alba]|eukprot:XP_009495834.1 hypothetical protein H696_03696 [Fonticula alba]
MSDACWFGFPAGDLPPMPAPKDSIKRRRQLWLTLSGECAILRRLVYKNNYQHSKFPHYRSLQKVVRMFLHINERAQETILNRDLPAKGLSRAIEQFESFCEAIENCGMKASSEMPIEHNFALVALEFACLGRVHVLAQVILGMLRLALERPPAPQSNVLSASEPAAPLISAPTPINVRACPFSSAPAPGPDRTGVRACPFSSGKPGTGTSPPVPPVASANKMATTLPTARVPSSKKIPRSAVAPAGGTTKATAKMPKKSKSSEIDNIFAGLF